MVKRKRTEEMNNRARDKTDHWIIVHNPWFNDQQRRKPSLAFRDIQEIATWLCILLRCPWGKVHTIQQQTQISFVIAKVELEVEVASKLGKYYWAEFLKSPTIYERERYSCLFEYNYIQFGDQSEKQWKESYPSPLLPPGDFPVLPFPPGPVWCERPVSHQCPIDWSISLVAAHGQMQNPESSAENDGAPGVSFRVVADGTKPALANDGIGLKRDIETAVKNEDDDEAAVKTEDDENAVKLEDDGVVAIIEDDRATVKFEGNGATVKFEGNGVAVKLDETSLKLEEGEVKIKLEDNTPELDFPGDELGGTSRIHGIQSIKEEPGGAGVPRSISQYSTQFLLVKNPFGVQWVQGRLLPDVSNTWDWVEQFIKDAFTLYVDTSKQDAILLSLPARVDLNGILGRHLWREMLEDCPLPWQNEVSTVVRCREEDLRGGVQINRPASGSTRGLFRGHYPTPLPFMHEHDDLKIKLEA